MNGHIVLVCRNNLALSQACLRTLQAQTIPAEVLIIENASTDGTVQWAKRQNCWTVSFAEPKSVAYCWNRGCEWAWANGAQECLIVNNDTELLPGTYQRLLEEHQEEGLLTCISIRERERLVDPRDVTKSQHPDFSCFMIWRWAWETVGPFDEECFPAYTEDSRYHVRMWRRGIKAASISFPFLHHGAGTLRTATPEEQKVIQEGADKNRKRFHEIYGCFPGTKRYEDLFSEQTFGVDC